MPKSLTTLISTNGNLCQSRIGEEEGGPAHVTQAQGNGKAPIPLSHGFSKAKIK
jgi:hypothetical protein